MKKKKRGKFLVILILLMLVFHSISGNIDYSILFNLQALEIIFAGIVLTSIIGYTYDTLVLTTKMVAKSFKYHVDYEGSIYKMYTYAVKIKKHGVLKVQKDIQVEDHEFVQKSLELVSDMTKAKDVDDILTKDIIARKTHLTKAYNVLKTISQTAPAFGLIGTLIGMIGLLSHMENSVLLINNMSSALVSTLYGALVSNFIAIPLMGRLREMIDHQILEYQIIKAGAVQMSQNDTVRNVFNKMNAMLPLEKRLAYPQNQKNEGGRG
jgi:chemotaxis protein MotA